MPNKTEVRKIKDEIDEIVVWKESECVVHIEQMSDTSFWIGIGDRNFYFKSKSGRAKVEIIES